MAQPGQVKHEHEHECHWQLPLKPNYVLVCDGKPDPRPVGTLAKDDCWGEFGDCRGWLIFGWAYPLWILASMSGKVLVVDDPNRPEWGTTLAPYEPWNPVLDRKTWDFDSADIALLEEGKTLFRGDVAFYLEEGDDAA